MSVELTIQYNEPLLLEKILIRGKEILSGWLNVPLQTTDGFLVRELKKDEAIPDAPTLTSSIVRIIDPTSPALVIIFKDVSAMLICCRTADYIYEEFEENEWEQNLLPEMFIPYIQVIAHYEERRLVLAAALAIAIAEQSHTLIVDDEKTWTSIIEQSAEEFLRRFQQEKQEVIQRVRKG